MWFRRLLMASLGLCAAAVHAQSSCSATNDNQDASCSISCEVGQAAVCRNGTGSSTPTCECTGSSIDIFRKSIANVTTGADKGQPQIASTASTVNTTPVQRLEQTNVLDVINQRLAKLQDFELGRQCRQVQDGQICRPIRTCVLSVPNKPPTMMSGMHCGETCLPRYKEVCTTVVGKLTATTPLLLQSEPQVTIKEPNWSDIPSQVIGYRESYNNCSDVEQGKTFKHSTVSKAGTRITKSKVLRTGETNGLTINAKVTFKVADIAGEVGGSTSRTVAHEVVVTDAKEEFFDETVSLEETMPVRVPPMSLVTVDHSWVRREGPIPFQGFAVLDAPLTTNLSGKTFVSQVLPSQGDRTFPFEGTVHFAFHAEGKTSLVQRKLTPAECGSNKALSVKGEAWQ